MLNEVKNFKMYEVKESLLYGVAKLSLIANGDVTTEDSIQTEKSRLERVIEPYYVKTEVEYNQFVINFLRDNFEEIIYGDTFLGDVEIGTQPDEEKYYL